MNLHLSLPVSDILSVGATREKYLARLGIVTVEDLLFFFPKRYHDLRNFKKISALVFGEVSSVRGRVLGREEKRVFRHPGYLKVAVTDDTGVLFLIFFNQPYLKDTFLPDGEFFINGRVDIYKNELRMTNPLFEKKRAGRRDLLLPVYPLTKGLTQNYIRTLVKIVVERLEEFPPDLLPFRRRQNLSLPNMKFALANIHFPRSDMELEKARGCLIFNEFLRLQLGLLIRKRAAQNLPAAPVADATFTTEAIDEFERYLPFVLTGGQRKVMGELLDDLRAGKRLQRLVQGEVGAGKTVIAVFLLWLFARRGFQGALLAPTEILAEQHFLNWQEFFLRQELNVRLLVRELPEKEKAAIAADVKAGGTQVLIGTHALLGKEVEFRNLKMLVIDEQHKFGVRQREALAHKGEESHCVIMSATPIPRSVALTFYGSLDFSTIGELPKGERKVVTYLFSGGEKERVYEFIRRQMEEENQGFFVTPSIESNEDIRSATAEYEVLKGMAPEGAVGLVHGRLPYEEKERMMDGFKQGTIKLLVATAVVESGIDVPAASYIVIDQAERFGLAQLHQLRGRVGRAGEVGYCFLVSYTGAPDIQERLEMFLQTESGLEIAEMDLKLRGPGDLRGVRQHGVLPLRIGNIVTDLRTLDRARGEAGAILDEDPGLNRPENAGIKQFLEESAHHGL